MREVKFRGLELMTGEWVYGSHLKTGTGLEYIVPQNLISNHLPQYSVDKDTVGQYTGLKDKNGVEIHESDIVLVENFVVETIKPFHAVVEWDKTRYALNQLGNLDVTNYPAITPNGIFGPFNTLSDFGQSFEVIGNIYDHPHLLEDK